MPNKGWRSVRLEDLLESVFAGAWGESSTDVRRPNVRVLRATNINSEGRVDYSRPALRVLEAREISRKRLHPGDLLLEASGGGPGTPVGRVALHKAQSGKLDYICSNFFRVLRPNVNLVHPGYLTHLLVAVYRSPRIWRYQQQTTGLVNLKLGDYLKQSLWLPPMREQARIVEVIDSFTALERGSEAAIAKMHSVRKGMLVELTSSSRVGQSAESHNMPAGSFAPLGQVLERIEVGVASIGPEAAPAPGDWGVIRLGAVTSGRFDSAQVKRLPASVEPRRSLEITSGDLLMVRVNGSASLVGSVVVVDNPAPRLLLSDLVMRLVPKSRILDSDFLGAALSAPSVRRQMMARFRGTSGQFQIPQGELKSVVIPLPDLSTQREAVATLKAFDEQISHETGELGKLRNLRRGLVDDLLSGRVAAPV